MGKGGVAIPQEVGGHTRNGGDRKTQEGRSAVRAAMGVAEAKQVR
jgi:hypothetical protein